MGYGRFFSGGKSGLVRVFALLLMMIFPAMGFSYGAEPGEQFKLDVKQFSLENGMLFLVVERHTTPQVACRLSIRAGSALEEAGKTGIAHMLEHMMFKGTKNFGTLDAQKDQELQVLIEKAYQAAKKEQLKRNPDRAFIREKLQEMERLRAQVQKIYVPQAFSMQLEKNGAVDVNAFTSRDETQFTASLPSDMIEQWFSIISEQIFEPSWREFYVEKEVVQREWAFRYVNSPEGAAWLDLNATAYVAHPYHNPVIGWKSDMEMYTTADAIDFHKKHYNPTNAVCVLVGDLTVNDAKKLAKTYFERYPPGRRAPEKVTEEPLQEGSRRSVRYLRGARKPIVVIGFHGARMGSKDFYALDAINMILSSGRSARITQDIEEAGLAQEAWCWNPDNRYGGMFILGGSPNEPIKTSSLDDREREGAYLKACKELEDILLHEVERLKTEPVSQEELERIKKLNRDSFLRGLKENEKLAQRLASLEVQVGWSYIESYLGHMDEVTKEDIQTAARNFFHEGNMTSVYVIPGGEAPVSPVQYQEIRSASGSAPLDSGAADMDWNRSIYPTPENWKHPLSFRREPKKVEYPVAKTAEAGGAQVFYLPDRELPLIDLTLLVKAGSVDVAEDKAGLSTLLQKCLVSGGTEKYDPKELAVVMDKNAIHLTVKIGEEESLIKLSVIKEDLEKGLSLLEEVLARPRFDDDILNVKKDETINELKRQGGDARSVLKRETDIWHFKGHPYGRDPLAGLDTIPRLTREDLRSFLKKFFVPSNMVASVAGDIEFEEVLGGLKKLFKAFPPKDSPGRGFGDPPETPPVLVLVDKPGQVQSQVSMALRGVKRTHPDFWKLNLLTDILGGSDSLMYKRLRDAMGLVYVAGFYETYMWRAGVLRGYIGVSGPNTGQAIEETVSIIKGLRHQVPGKMIEQKRLDSLNSFVFNLDDRDDLVKAYGLYALRKEPLDTLDKIQESYMTVTKDELQSLAKKFLDPERLQIFVVADKTTVVKREDGSELTLGQDLRGLAGKLGLPFREIPLR